MSTTPPGGLRLVVPLPPKAKAPHRRKGKRADGEGSVFQTGTGRWVARAAPERGSGRRREFTAKTQAEAIAKRDAHERRATQKGGAADADPRLGAYLADWLDNAVKPHHAHNTHKARLVAVGHIVDEIGALRLSEIRPDDVARMMTALATKKRRSGSVLAASTVNGIRDTLATALNDARRAERLVGSNPASLARKLKTPTRALHVPDVAAVNLLLGTVSGHRLCAAFVVAAKLGLRNGEICGLRWADLDLDGATPTLSVTGQLQRIKRETLRVPPKAGSKGVIPLAQDVVAALVAHRGRQREARRAFGPAWADTLGLVFTQADGRPVYGAALGGTFKRALANAGLPSARPVHCLRHFVGTVVTDAVGPKSAQQLLRHKSLATTLAYYVHDTPEAMQKAVFATACVTVPASPAVPPTMPPTPAETRETP